MGAMKRWTRTAGSLQGAVISPLLANIYLHELDVEMRKAGLVMVRYADDVVVLCRSREEAQSALARMRARVTENGLMLHPDKTHLGDCRVHILDNRWLCSPSFTDNAAQIKAPTGPRTMLARS